MVAVKQWGRDTWAGLRTTPACLSLLGQAGLLAAVLFLVGTVWAAVSLSVWHLLLSAAPFMDRVVRKSWLVGPVTPNPAVLRRGGRLPVWAYVLLHWCYAALYAAAAAWVQVRFGNRSGLGLLLAALAQ